MSETVTTPAGRLTLSTPDALLASIPHLIGFPPTESVVIVGIAAERPNGPSTVRLTQRVDRPPADSTLDDVRDMAREVAAPMLRSGSTEVIITVFADQTPGTDGILPETALVDELVTAFDELGVRIRDTLFTDGTSRWSYGCTDPACCPPSGRVIPQELRTLVAAEFTGAGSAIVPSRKALVAEVAPADPDALADVSQHVAIAEAAREQAIGDRPPTRGRSSNTNALETWREETLATIAAVTSREPATPSSLAGAALGLGDVRVRDTVLWDLMRPGVDTDAAIAGLTAVVRHAPAGHVAPAATVLAVCHWTSGDGARANAALERAVEDDPAYSLSVLVGASLRAGLPPQSWREAMAGLTRDTCRHGDTPPRPRPAAAPRARRSVTSPGLAL